MLVGPIPSRYALLIPKGFLQSFHHLDSESVCSIVRNVRIVACFCNGDATLDVNNSKALLPVLPYLVDDARSVECSLYRNEALVAAHYAQEIWMGQSTRTTKLSLDLGARTNRGANTGKRAYLEATVDLLNLARSFYVAFFLAHREKLTERVFYFAVQQHEVRERVINADELLTWAEFHTVITKGHPTLYTGTVSLELDRLDLRERFVRVKVYTGEMWRWVNFPVIDSRYFERRRAEPGWEQHSPKLVLCRREAELHFPQTKEVKARKVKESKFDPDLVTVAVDLNVKHLAVIAVRQHHQIIETAFVTDQGLDQLRYRHLKRIGQKQWLSGAPVKGERNATQLWRHIRRMNTDAAHKTARSIACICTKYPGCTLLFERLRKIKARGGTNSRRCNRKQANQLRGQINRLAKEKAIVSKKRGKRDQTWAKRQYFGPLDGREPSFYT